MKIHIHHNCQLVSRCGEVSPVHSRTSSNHCFLSSPCRFQPSTIPVYFSTHGCWHRPFVLPAFIFQSNTHFCSRGFRTSWFVMCLALCSSIAFQRPQCFLSILCWRSTFPGHMWLCDYCLDACCFDFSTAWWMPTFCRKLWPITVLFERVYQLFEWLILTARRYASTVLAVIVCLSVCPSVCPSVCLSQVGVVQRRLNLGSH